MNSTANNNNTNTVSQISITFDGPAGTGKTTLIKNLVEKRGDVFSEPANPEIVTMTANRLKVELNSLIKALGQEQAVVPILMGVLKGNTLGDDEERERTEVRDRGVLAQLLYLICNGVKCSVDSEEYEQFLATHLLGVVNGKVLETAWHWTKPST